jgi:hypothetical protein
MRLSSAVRPIAGMMPWYIEPLFGKIGKSKIFPCAAIKCFRDGSIHSGNLLFGGKKTGQDDDLYFKNSMSTILSETTPMTLRWVLNIFKQYSAFPTSLGLSDFALWKSDGIEEDQPNFPWCLVLAPKSNVKASSFTDIEKIPSHTPIFDIYAVSNPQSVLNPINRGLELIGEIISLSEMIPSYPDDGLRFKHQRKEEDYELRPDWIDEITPAHSEIGSKTFDEIFQRFDHN